MASIHKVTWVTASGEAREAHRVSFYADDGKGRQVKRFRQFSTARKARRFVEDDLAATKKAVKQQAAQGPLIADLARLFLAACRVGRSGGPPLEEETVADYRRHLDNYIVPALGTLPIGALAARDVRSFRDDLVACTAAPATGRRSKTLSPAARSATAPAAATPAGAALQIPGDPCGSSRHTPSTSPAPSPPPPSSEAPPGSPRVSPWQRRGPRRISRTTAKKILTTLRTMCGWAIEEGYISTDPTHRVAIRLSSRTQKQIEIHSRDEMRRLLEAARAMQTAPGKRLSSTWARYYPLLLVLVYAGLRISEARGIRRQDVDATACVLDVKQRADRKGRIGAPKSRAGNRRLHVPPVVIAALQAWLATHNHELVFPTDTGKPLSTENFRKICWDVVQEKAGVRRLGIHSARHFFVSSEIDRGTPLKEITEMIGHSDPAFTLKVYGHLFRDREAEQRRAQQAAARVL